MDDNWKTCTKYRDEASKYQKKANKAKDDLSVFLQELNKVNDMFDLKSDIKDMLTYNVLVANEDLKSEVKNIGENISSTISNISIKAYDLDKEEETILNKVEE